MSFIGKYVRALQTFGLKGSLEKMYSVGDIKFGALKGIDRIGNKYYENAKDYPFGQHRWVEYKDIHNYDAAMVPPEWHGWLHHQTDYTPDEEPDVAGRPRIETAQPELNDTLYKHHKGLVDESTSGDQMHNKSLFRQRGFGVGTLAFQPAGAEDQYYKQPGHPMSAASDRGGRFEKVKGLDEFDPQDPRGEKATAGKPLRDYDQI
ncbi:unnamed protein product [Heterosigma akashiwo]